MLNVECSLLNVSARQNPCVGPAQKRCQPRSPPATAVQDRAEFVRRRCGAKRLGLRWVRGWGHTPLLGMGKHPTFNRERLRPVESGVSPFPRQPPQSKTSRRSGWFLERENRQGMGVNRGPESARGHPGRSRRDATATAGLAMFRAAARMAARRYLERAGVRGLLDCIIMIQTRRLGSAALARRKSSASRKRYLTVLVAMPSASAVSLSESD